jgi:hypothetical protein
MGQDEEVVVEAQKYLLHLLWMSLIDLGGVYLPHKDRREVIVDFRMKVDRKYGKKKEEAVPL